MRRTNILRGLVSLVSTVLVFALIMTKTAFSFQPIINSTLNTKNVELVSLDEGADAIYFASDYGDATNLTQENLDALLKDEDAFVEREMEEGAVLLRNENNTLPLKPEERRITLFGLASAHPLYKDVSGGGNNDPTRQISFYDALKERGFEINNTLFEAYAAADATRRDPNSPVGFTNYLECPASFYTDELKSTFAEYNDAAIVVITRFAGENNDIPLLDEQGLSPLALHQEEIDLLNMIYESGEFDKIIMINNSAYPLELGYLEKYHIDACLWVGTPGLVGFRGVADLLTGDANPSGKLVDTYAADSHSAAATQNFGDFGFTNAEEMDKICADYDAWISSAVSRYLIYQEGIYVGYKYYETRYEDCVLGQGNADGDAGTFASKNGWDYADEVVFPFGYGLSYTNFEQTLDSVSESNNTMTVKVTVTNTGNVAGKSVVEVYVQTPYTDYDRQNSVEKAAIQLVGFDKTNLLQPGESETVTVDVDKYLFASYDPNGAKGYIMDAGDYYIAVGDDVHDALNNILAAKGATGMVNQDGNSVSGDIAKTYRWTQDELDTETYRYSNATGAEVTNLFDDADINYWIENAVTYLTRQDWQSTFPQPVEGLTATDEMIREIDGYLYKTSETATSVSDYTQGADNGLSLVEMRDVPFDDPKWEQFIDQLTLDDMVGAVDEYFGTKAVEAVFKPETRFADGPGGISGPYLPDKSAFTGVANSDGIKGSGTAYVGEAVAASQWNKEMIAQRGYFIAEDALFCGVTQAWAPASDLHRSSFGGRIFEYYSEDSTLSYLLAIEEVKAMQEKGVAAAIKHFAMNDQEKNRCGVATFATEQAMREIYLRCFEGAFTEAGALSTMTAFNRIGCTYAGHNEALLKSLLREEWGFLGATISDAAFFDFQHAVEGLVGGTDLWCLSSINNGPELKAYIETNDDGDLFQLLRESQHRYYYMLANTSLINGLTDNMEYVEITPWWQTALYAVDGGLAILTVMLLVAYIVAFRKNKSEN